MDKVSVYIPCYNAEKYIVRAVESLLSQTVRPDEVLVIDDGCTDQSMEVISGYSVRVISMGNNQGLAAARNRAYQEAKNELIACIDADCEATPTWLDQLLRDFPRDCAGTGGKTVEANQARRADRWRAQHMPLHWGDKGLMNPKVIYGANQLFKKSAIMDVGLLDATKVVDDYKIGYEDLELARKLYKAGYKLFYNPQAIVYHLRCDTPRSIIRQYWRWSVFYYPEPRRLSIFILKIVINFLKALKHITYDLVRGDFHLIPISTMIFPWHSYYDWEYFQRVNRQMAS